MGITKDGFKRFCTLQKRISTTLYKEVSSWYLPKKPIISTSQFGARFYINGRKVYVPSGTEFEWPVDRKGDYDRS